MNALLTTWESPCSCGGKADSLLRLQQMGMCVPPFSVVPDVFFRETAEEAWESELAALCAHLPDDVRYAVRSSAAGEDGADHSFAGQFETILRVEKAELPAMICRCYRSQENASAAAYCAARSHWAETKMHVIVQQQVEADCAGVLFSANPQGILNETVISVGFGTGEGVVNGSAPVTTYYYNRTDERYYAVPEADAPALTEEQIGVLLAVCKRLEEEKGGYHDVEFAFARGKLFVLQCRPITTLSGDAPLVMDNSNIVESYPGLSLPLTVSFVEEAYYGVFRGVAARVLKSDRTLALYESTLQNMIGSVNGRIYYKISNWYSILKVLPFSDKIIPVWQEMMGVRCKQADGAENRQSPLRRIRTYLNSAWELLAVPRNMKKLNVRFSEVETLFQQGFPQADSIPALAALYQRISDQVLCGWEVTLLNDMYAFIYTALLKSALRPVCEDRCAEEANRFITGISNIESMKPIRALLSLAVQCRAEELMQTLSQLSDDAAAQCWIEQTDSDFARGCMDYIARYGDRAPEELKLETVTYRQSPLQLIRQILEYARDAEWLHTATEQLGTDRTEVNAEILSVCSPWRRCMVRACSKRAARGIGNREISRLNRTRIYGMVRRIFLRAGEICCRQGNLDEIRDVFWLRKEEIFRGDAARYRAIIHARKAEYEHFRLLPPASRIVFEKEPFDKHHQAVNQQTVSCDERTLQGTACSNGIAEGTALVLENPFDVKGAEGCILIARMTDPGWVFLLATAKGIVSEKGSLLSHTAIISRELNIPAAVGVADACARIRTGDQIRLDGTKGTVTILSRKEEGTV